MTFGLKVVIGVVGVIVVAVGLLLAAPALMLSCVFSGTQSGTPIDAGRGRQIVAAQNHVLQRALALAERSPRPARDDPACRALATELGALDIRFEDRQGGALVIVTYSRGGIPETYETQLTWAPAATAERVRAGHDRLGESFEYLDHGWWWVFW